MHLFQKKLSQSIATGDIDEVKTLLSFMETFFPSQDKSFIAKKLTLKIEALAQEKKNYTAALTLFCSLQPSKEEKEKLISSLVEKTLSLWKEKKIALQAVVKRLEKLEPISTTSLAGNTFIQKNAENTKEPSELTALLDLETVTKGTQLHEKLFKELTQHELKAKKHFKEKEFAACHQEVDLIAAIDPKNEKNNLLKAETLLKEKRYEEALDAFKAVPEDAQVKEYKALLSILLAPKDKRATLAQKAQKLSEETRVRIALLLLEEALYEEAAIVFEETKEGLLLTPTCFFLGGNIEKALAAIEKLPEHIQQSGPMIAIKLQCLLLQHNEKGAKELVENLPKEIQVAESSQKVAAFLEAPENNLSLLYAQCLYADQVLDNPIFALKLYEKLPKLSPKALFEKTNLLLELGFYEKAKKEIEQYPPSEHIYVKLAQANYYMHQGNLLAAEKILRRLEERQNSFKPFRRLFAKLLQKLHRFDFAENQYNWLFKHDENDTDSLLQHVNTLIHRKINVKAFQMIDFLSKKKDLSLRQKIDLARISSLGKQNFLLNNLWQELPEQYTTRDLAAILELLEQIGSLQKAFDLLTHNEKIVALVPALLLEQAKLASELGEKEQAETLIKKLLEENSSFVRTKEPLLSCMGDKELIVKQFTRYKEQAAKEHAKKIFLIFPKIAFLFEVEKKYPSLIPKEDKELLLLRYGSLLEIFCSARRDLSEPLFWMGKFAQSQHEDKEAKKHFEQALELDPSFALASWEKGKMELKKEDFFEAQKALRNAIFFLPAKAELWVTMAQVTKKARDIHTSRFCLEEAVKLQPNNAKLLVDLAAVLLELQNPESARTYLKRALSITPNNVRALKLAYKCLLDPLVAESFESKKLLEKEKKEIMEKLNQN